MRASLQVNLNVIPPVIMALRREMAELLRQVADVQPPLTRERMRQVADVFEERGEHLCQSH